MTHLPESYFITAKELQELENNGGYEMYRYRIEQKLEENDQSR